MTKIKEIWYPIAVAVSLGALATPAAAQGPECAPYDQAVRILNEKFDERRVFVGLDQSGTALVEVYLAPGGSWSLVVVDTSNMACMVASGEAGEAVPMAAGKPA